METKAYKLDSLCEITSSKRIFYSEYTENGIPFFRSKEIIDLFNKNNISTELFISESRYYEIKNKFGVPEEDDMLLTSVGSIGIPYLVKSSDKFYFKDGNLTWFRNYNRKLIVPLYLYLWTTSSVGKETLMRLSMGAAQPALTISRLKNLSLNLPSVSVQQKIASILSSYDRLIENNTRRIRLLEQMAENLYKEWFVRFRFPEHENVEMVNGLPKGWEVKRISNVCETIGGGTPSTTNSAYWGGDIKWVTPSDITSKKSLALLKIAGRITEEGLKKSSAKLLPPYTILMTSRASIGFFGICPDNVCTNQGFISIIPNKDNVRMYLLYTFKARKEEIISNANGSTFLEISKGRFRKMKLLVPTEDILNMFEKRTMLNFREVLHLEMQNQLLIRQRDLLLPRLMSGKLEVKS